VPSRAAAALNAVQAPAVLEAAKAVRVVPEAQGAEQHRRRPHQH